MNEIALEQNITDVIFEQQLKLGYRKERVLLYYPLESLNHLLDVDCDVLQMLAVLENFAENRRDVYGDFLIQNTGDRFCIGVSEKGTEYIFRCGKNSEFLKGLIDLVAAHGTKMEDIISYFQNFSCRVIVEKMEEEGFDFLLYFEDGKPDAYRYCFSIEPCHISYHRFTPYDYDSIVEGRE